jgi:hypothetical protein
MTDQEKINEAVKDLDKYVLKINEMIRVSAEGIGSQYIKLRLMQNIIEHLFQKLEKEHGKKFMKIQEKAFQEYLKFKKMKLKGEKNEN